MSPTAAPKSAPSAICRCIRLQVQVRRDIVTHGRFIGWCGHWTPCERGHQVTRHPSVCPHDCPYPRRQDNWREAHRPNPRRARWTCTSGLICAWAARYYDRIHHPDWLTRPLRLVGRRKTAATTFLRVSEGDVVQPGNERGRTRLLARMFEGVRPGVLVKAFGPLRLSRRTGGDNIAPHGGMAFRDLRCRRVERERQHIIALSLPGSARYTKTQLLPSKSLPARAKRNEEAVRPANRRVCAKRC